MEFDDLKNEISTSFRANFSDLLQMVALAKRSTAEAKKRPQCLSVPAITSVMAKTRKFIVKYIKHQKSIFKYILAVVPTKPFGMVM